MPAGLNGSASKPEPDGGHITGGVVSGDSTERLVEPVDWVRPLRERSRLEPMK
jgi:hypothetical protein